MGLCEFFLTSVRRHSLFWKPWLRGLQQPTAFLFLRYIPPSVPEVMGNRKISNDLKECALNLWNWGWDLEDITDALLVSRSSLWLLEIVSGLLITPLHLVNWEKLQLARNSLGNNLFERVKIVVQRKE